MRVILAGGFGVPPSALTPLRRHLDAAGYDVVIAPLGFNVDCGERAVERLLELVDTDDAPVAVVGHSRGGQLARVAAVRRPDRVAALVTAGTPWRMGPPQRPGVGAVAAGLRWARARGVDLLPSIDCATADCCVAFRRDVEEKPAAQWTALWSSRDRVAGDDGKPPASADVEIDTRTSHLGFIRDRRGQVAITDALASMLAE